MDENRKGAYKFTNKLTGEVKYGLLHTSGVSFDIFRTTDGEDIKMENPDMTGSITKNGGYEREWDETYAGPFPTWETE